MSLLLVDQIGGRPLDSILGVIDSWVQNSLQTQDQNLTVGPFGVLALSGAVSGDQTDTAVNHDTYGFSISFHKNQYHSMSSSSPSTLSRLDWPDLFDLDFGIWPELQHDQYDLVLPNSDFNVGFPVSNVAVLQSGTDPMSDLLPESIDDTDLQNETSHLLHHFAKNVIAASAALPYVTKSPFEILNLPAAVQTLADVTYLKRSAKYANFANLYSILAFSSYHLGVKAFKNGSEDEIYWTSIANNARVKAKAYLHSSLESEMQGSKKAKYKDQLMALMSMLAFCASAGQQEDARHFMMETERLFRIRGVGKRYVSRRTRLLHHMYAWFRIVGESTYVLHANKGRDVASSIGSGQLRSGDDIRLDDFRQTEYIDNLGRINADEHKGHEVCLRDIHLQDPRQNPTTMYLQIYGISETWLSLLSQITRLANIEHFLQPDSKTQASLRDRIARLENVVCSYASGTWPAHHQAESVLAPTNHMLQALKSALVIFFYRRLRHVNKCILQTHVDEVINALDLFQQSVAEQNICGPGTAWPAFIAGCEANPGPRREILLKWMDTALSKTGFQCYRGAKEMMQEVWCKQDDITAASSSMEDIRSCHFTGAMTWIDMSREKHKWLILC